jgi:hypothetical protein
MDVVNCIQLMDVVNYIRLMDVVNCIWLIDELHPLTKHDISQKYNFNFN